MIVNIHEAKTSLSKLVESAANGEEIIIARAGRPVARLVKLEEKPRRQFGWAKSVTIADDFDAPLPADVQSAFEGN